MFTREVFKVGVGLVHHDEASNIDNDYSMFYGRSLRRRCRRMGERG
jgi:hypothetical protein